MLLFFSQLVMWDSWQTHGLQHARHLCPLPSPGVCSNSYTLSQWCHPVISSCRPLLLLPSIFPSIGVIFNESIYASGGQSTGHTHGYWYFSQQSFPDTWPQDWKRSVFIPIPKKGNAKECSNYSTIALISHASKVILKILPDRLQQKVNRELPNVQAGFRKGRGTRDEIANIWWNIEEARELQKNIYFCFIDYNKAFDSVDHHKLWKILKEMGIPDNLTCLQRNLEVKKQQ